jgi:Na+-driven multidrug efflux pump
MKFTTIAIIIGSGIILSFILTIIPILLSYDIRDEIIELIEDLDNQIVVDTSVYKTNLP